MEIKLKDKSTTKTLIKCSIEGAKIILNQIENCICKIYQDKCSGYGFFMKIPYKSNHNLPVLITNSFILNQNRIKNNNILELTLNDDKIYKRIELNKNRKIIKILKYDIILIEIFPLEDNINNYLELDENIDDQNIINTNKSIYAFQYNGNNIQIIYSLFKDISFDDISNNNYKKENLYFYPILSLDNFKIIGINEGNLNNDFNLLCNIKYIINEFINQFKEIKNELNELNINYLLEGKDEKIKIFDELFVNNNKKNCKIIISENEFELVDYIDLTKIKTNNNLLKIKLKEIKTITNMSYMFYNCKSLLSFSNFDKWNTSNVLNINSLFYNCTNLKPIPDISNWDISNVTDIGYIFYHCSSLVSLPDISKWNTGNIKYMQSSFDGCSSLLSLPDISKWNTSSAIDISSLFRMCSSLLALPDISKWNTNNVVNMSEMFNGCKLLSFLPDISNWNTNKVINMLGIFANCSSLVSLPDISKWNTGKIWNMNGAFYRCYSLSYLPNISNWDIKKVIKKAGMFGSSINIVKIPNKFSENNY